MANDDLIQGDEISIASHNPYWEPTQLLRWRNIHFNNRIETRLEQLWHSGAGEQEWRAVPEVDFQ